MKSIISIIALCAGVAVGTADAAAQLVTSTDALSNTAAYTLNRRSSSASGYVASGTGTNVQVGAQQSAEQSLWSIHYSQTEKAYYLYNITAGKFVGANGGKAVLTDTPTDMVPLYVDHIAAWIIDCGGALLGMADNAAGTAIFLEDYSSVSSRQTGLFYQISTSTTRTLTQEESDAIEARIKAGRPDMLAKYVEFVSKAKAMTSDGLTNYAGAYDIDKLEKMLADADKYAINEIDAAYRAAINSRLPQEGRYYVLRDLNRPSSFKNNSLSIGSDGTLTSRQQALPKIGGGSSSFPEGLNLFCIEHPTADLTSVVVRCAATGQYLISNGNNNAKLTMGDRSLATVFTLEPRGDFNRQFRFRLPDDKGWVTVSGENRLVNYNIAEEPNYFYFEQVKFMTATPNAHGILPLTLPCPVTVADDVDALIAVEEYDGKVYLEKHEGIIPAGVPFILRSPNGSRNVLLTVAGENPEFTNDNILVGTTLLTQAPNPHYSVTSTAESLTFTRKEATANIQANSAYLLSGAEGDLVTSTDPRPNAHITEIDADGIDATNSVWYDLQGRRVATPAPGHLYIDGTSHRLILVK